MIPYLGIPLHAAEWTLCTSRTTKRCCSERKSRACSLLPRPLSVSRHGKLKIGKRANTGSTN